MISEKDKYLIYCWFFPPTKNGEICNFYCRYTLQLWETETKKIQINHSLIFKFNHFYNNQTISLKYFSLIYCFLTFWNVILCTLQSLTQQTCSWTFGLNAETNNIIFYDDVICLHAVQIYCAFFVGNWMKHYKLLTILLCWFVVDCFCTFLCD